MYLFSLFEVNILSFIFIIFATERKEFNKHCICIPIFLYEISCSNYRSSMKASGHQGLLSY